MKRIIATTALTLALTAGFPAAVSYADSHSAMMKTYQKERKGDFFAADFIGKEIYTSEKEWDENTTAKAGAEKEWDNIGQVENVVLNQDGTVKAVILQVGGFLDIGDKHVAVPMDQLSFIRNEDSWDEYFLAVKTSKDQLMKEEAFQYASDEQRSDMNKPENAEAKDETKSGETSGETNTESAMQKDEDGRPMLRQPAMVEREGYAEAKPEELTADKLTGARVYGSKDEDIGEIGKLVMSDDGKVKKVVLDVGGFIGIGEKEVAVTMQELRIVRNEDASDFRVYVDATKDELESQPTYEGS